MNKIIKKIVLIIVVLVIVISTFGCSKNDLNNKNIDENKEEIISVRENFNPVLPGYFADPSAYKFGDNFYIFATSCGYHVNQEAGWPMVWSSKDFVNWEAKKLDLRNKNGKKFDAKAFFWAPSCLEHDGKYYLSFTYNDYFTYIAVSDTPDGEYTVLGNLNDRFFKSKTIDSQLFKDDDGRIYMVYLWNVEGYINTAIAELDPKDPTKVLEMKKIPELSGGYREGQEILKKDGKYYIIYSEGNWTNESYHVRYAMADDIYGPYTVKGPILVSNPSLNIYGAGHHSTLKVDDKYYMVYHRQSYPINNYVRRQTCANEMVFNEEGDIESIVPDHKGVGYLGTDEVANKYINIAGDATVITDDNNSEFKPEFINDNDYSTLWKTDDRKFPKYITLDFGESKNIEKTELYFEYPSKYYRYILEYSNDNENWELYADKSDNREAISPYVDTKSINARYIRLTITGMEAMGGAYGLYKGVVRSPVAGVFEFKVFTLK